MCVEREKNIKSFNAHLPKLDSKPHEGKNHYTITSPAPGLGRGMKLELDK